MAPLFTDVLRKWMKVIKDRLMLYIKHWGEMIKSSTKVKC